jgi:hypothetical protein
MMMSIIVGKIGRGATNMDDLRIVKSKRNRDSRRELPRFSAQRG